jgi:hypothetical protein
MESTKMTDPKAMRLALKQAQEEIAELIALIGTVAKPGEKLSGLQAIRRCLDNDDPDTAAEIAVYCACGDPDVPRNEGAMTAAVYRLFDRAMAL